MQPVKLVIPGDYWDCQLYSGRLYLWGMDGHLATYDWDAIVESLTSNRRDKFVLLCAFARGDYLYSFDRNFLLSDPDMDHLLRTKFDNIGVSRKTWEVSPGILDKCLIGKVQDNPFRDLPIDTEIFKNQLFASSDEGLFVTEIKRQKRYRNQVVPHIEKLWDCPITSIRANRGSVALAAGSEGLFELDTRQHGEYVVDSEIDVNGPTFLDGFAIELDSLEAFEEEAPLDAGEQPRMVEQGIAQLSDRHCSVANWSYASIYSSSYLQDGYLAAFGWERQGEHYHRVFRKIVPQREIFEPSGFTWGSGDKIYRSTVRGLDVVRYSQRYVGSDRQEKAFEHLESLPFAQWKGSIIGGGTAYFGVIVECENALVVLQSNGESFTIPGATTRWRVYPRSQRYENHLHVILNDRLEIYSFNHDYFVDQWEKVAGIRYG